MANKLTVNDISVVQYQADVTSGQHRKNYANIRNRHNALCDALDASTIGTTNAETTASRPYNDSLSDKLNVMGGNINTVISGGDVLQKATANMTVKVKAFNAIVGGVAVSRGFGTFTSLAIGTIATITEYAHGFSNGDVIYVDVSSSTSKISINSDYTISNVTTNTFDIVCNNAGDSTGSVEYSRYTGTMTSAGSYIGYNIVVINSDASISVLLGSAVNTIGIGPYPVVSSTQRPLAVLRIQAGSTAIATANITENKTQGCIANRQKWFFTIQGAVDDSSGGSLIEVMNGTYVEEVDLSGYSNIDIRLSSGTIIARLDAASYCIKSINSSGNETTGNRVSGGQLEGNERTGSIELLKVTYTDECSFTNIVFDGNAYSTAAYPNMVIDNCNVINLTNLQLLTSDVYDSTSYNITNSTTTATIVNDLDVVGNTTCVDLDASGVIDTDLHVASNKSCSANSSYLHTDTKSAIYNLINSALNEDDIYVCARGVYVDASTGVEAITSVKKSGTNAYIYSASLIGALQIRTFSDTDSADIGAPGTAITISIS